MECMLALSLDDAVLLEADATHIFGTPLGRLILINSKILWPFDQLPINNFLADPAPPPFPDIAPDSKPHHPSQPHTHPTRPQRNLGLQIHNFFKEILIRA